MSVAPGYFVTGTGTDVGKTFVTCALARRAVSRGHRVFAFKPVETGCMPAVDGALVGADQQLLVAAAGAWQAGELAGLHRFRLAAAPLVAAAAESFGLDLARIVAGARAGMETKGVTFSLIEGAGGVRVPLTVESDMAAFAQQLGLPAIVVARAGLGTINHSLLTLEALARDHVPVAALVMSCRPDDDAEAAEVNREQIQRRWPGSVVMLGPDSSVLDPLIPSFM